MAQSSSKPSKLPYSTCVVSCQTTENTEHGLDDIRKQMYDKVYVTNFLNREEHCSDLGEERKF